MSELQYSKLAEYIGYASVDFPKTSFFRPRLDGGLAPKLPTPEAVRQILAGKTQGIARLESENLIIKYGPSSCVSVYEALVTMFVREQVGGEVPVPEVFGWRVEAGYVYIYFSLIPGQTLGDCWYNLRPTERLAISGQLGAIIAALRRMKQDPGDIFIGSALRGPLQDLYFGASFKAGPFRSIPAFNDWVQHTSTGGRLEKHLDPYRHLLCDASRICFTHADLHLGNIMISGPVGSRYVAGIIDWQQAGWYPEYWEYCKIHIGVDYEHQWRTLGWIDQIATCYESEATAFLEYWQWRCP